MNKTSYLILRMAIGTSMMGHGLVRLPKLSTFSTWMTGSFKNSMLPSVLVLPFSYLLPFAEFGIGVLILVGVHGGCIGDGDANLWHLYGRELGGDTFTAHSCCFFCLPTAICR